MGLANWFETFNKSIQISDDGTISQRYKRITKAVNQHFRDSSSETAYSWYVGSYGRNTAINSISDLDIIVQLPYETYVRYNGYNGNGQSALLQELKTAIQRTYSTSTIGADGQVVAISFNDGITFEVVPTFINKDGSFTFPNTNNGGSWETTNPFPEIESISDRNKNCNYNLVPLCRMLRAWKSKNNVSISGILIDTLAYQFIEGWQYKDKSYFYYDFLSRDVFEFISKLPTNQDYWRAPGSGRFVYGGGFQAKAKKAYDLSLEAIEYLAGNYEWSAKIKWGEIYGTDFPS